MTVKRQNDVSIIILTKNAGAGFSGTLRAVYAQEYAEKFEVIIIDSGSTDETNKIAKGYPTKIVNIKPEDFGHGRTRNLGARLAEGNFLAFLTSDAIPATDKWLSNLTRNFQDPNVAGVYGRQIPKEDTKPMEYFFLSNKYPSYQMVKQAGEGKTNMDIIFFSDVNSAIRKEIWEKHPFDDNIIVSEDTEWAKRVLLNSYKIVYEPEAAVYHSHNFSLRTLFQKYFDCGVSFNQFASNEYATDKFIAEGLSYTWQEMRFLIGNGYVKWLPYAVLYDLAKFLGVSLGKQEKWLPLSLKKYLGSISYYWRSQ